MSKYHGGLTNSDDSEKTDITEVKENTTHILRGHGKVGCLCAPTMSGSQGSRPLIERFTCLF